jgi:hypothetical protein
MRNQMAQEQTKTQTTEPTGQQQGETAQTQETQEQKAAERFKDDPIYNAMARQINELRKAQDAAEAKRKAAEDEAETKRMQEEGKYKELAAKAEAKAAQLAAEFKARERSLILEAKFASVENEFTRAGIIAKCPTGDDVNIDEYVAEIRKNHPTIFERAAASTEETTQAASVAPTSPRVAQGSRAAPTSTASLEERLRNADPSAQREAFERALSGK